MTSRPQVSVIIASYNGADVIQKAIDSALAQSVEDLEVVVVDDGSTDRAVAVVQRCAQADSRVRLIRHEVNKGISAARNTGIQSARGAFVCFLDQDDLWYPDRLASALALFAQDPDGEVGLVFGNEETRVLDTGALVEGRLPAPPDVNDLSRTAFLCALIQCNFVPTAAAMFRRACFDKLGLLDEQLKSGIDDFDMFLRVARHYKLRHVDKVQAIRHVHAGNFTKLGRMVPEMLTLLAQIAAQEPEVARIAHKARSHYLYLLSREQYRAQEYRLAIVSVAQAIRWRPSDLKCWLALGLTLTGPLGYALLGGGGRAQSERQVQT